MMIRSRVRLKTARLAEAVRRAADAAVRRRVFGRGAIENSGGDKILQAMPSMRDSKALSATTRGFEEGGETPRPPG